ncbi:MAG: hypothetical protein WCP52_11570, partial [Bacteroidota bacterium]
MPEKDKEKGFPLQSCAVIQRITLRNLLSIHIKTSPSHFCKGLIYYIVFCLQKLNHVFAFYQYINIM